MKIAFIQLARHGDILNLLPLLKRMADKGVECHVYCCREFAETLEGVSYVTPHAIGLGVKDVEEAYTIARAEGFEDVRISQYDNNRKKDKCKDISFALGQWQLATKFAEDALEYYQDPLVIDRRDRDREAKLRKDLDIDPQRNLLLVNLSSISSSYHDAPALMGRLKRRFDRNDHWQLIDLANVKATRLYDLLGLYERARALLTADTATYHLANAANVRTMLLRQSEARLQSPLRPHVLYHATYETALAKAEDIMKAVERID